LNLLENNDGIFMVASTNHLDQLDPGLSSRPSRFDRKYLFPLPSTEERVLYCDYWRAKLASKSSVKFPKKLCPAIAGITQDFSFAYLKEAFLSTLLAIAFNRSEDGIRGGGDDEGGDLDDYELWREIKKQVKLLRDDMDSRGEDIRHNLGVVEDLSWKDFDRATKVIPGSTLPTSADPDQYQLPYRTAKDSHRGTRRQQNPRLIGQEFDCDARQAPLMTDSGFFIDSRLDRNAGLQLL